ncbi:hypothetical protein V1478_014229 [Vespula squamosa]|uniref:Uncharacterized protein n=1 Tax=Vespula squamosa TaxID=30214 RepID=A0ABD2A7E5_VESSQ
MVQPVHTENNNSALDMESLEEMLRKHSFMSESPMIFTFDEDERRLGSNRPTLVQYDSNSGCGAYGGIIFIENVEKRQSQNAKFTYSPIDLDGANFHTPSTA